MEGSPNLVACLKKKFSSEELSGVMRDAGYLLLLQWDPSPRVGAGEGGSLIFLPLSCLIREVGNKVR